MKRDAELSRRQFVGTLATVGGVPVAAQRRPPSRRPNILFIIVDQWSATCFGEINKALRTPAVDSIAAAGVRFSNAYCTYPLCSPSRASMFTGRMPHETGVVLNVPENSRVVPDSMPVLGELFAEAGYETGYFGKEHTGGAAYRGFQSLGSIQFPTAGYLADGSVLDSVFIRDAIEFIQKRRDRPFLAVVSLINPHDICYTLSFAGIPQKSIVDACEAFRPRPGAYRKFLRGQEFPPLPPNFPAAPPPRMGTIGPLQQPWAEQDWRLYLATYYLLIENTDWLIGRVLEALRRAGLGNDTLILFTADHGDQMAAHQLVGKGVFYEEATKVPFLMAWKGVIEARHTSPSELVSGVDVLPTLCDYAGVRIPKGVTGRSVRPLVERRNAPWRRHLVSATYDGRMLVADSKKYVAYGPDKPAEFLFDLGNDPGETRDLAQDAGSKAALEAGRGMLASWMKETGGAFPTVPAEEMRKRLRGRIPPQQR